MGFRKILVLENDIEEQGLPQCLRNLRADNPDMQVDVWWWFRYDVSQNPEKSIKRFAQCAPDTFFVSNPSFAGYDNSFDGHLELFKVLMDKNIKISLGIAYHGSFFYYLLKWMSDENWRKARYKKRHELLKQCIDFHEIYLCNASYISYAHKTVSEIFTERLTFESLLANYFQEGEKVQIVATGEVKKLKRVWYSADEKYCTVNIYNGTNTISTAEAISIKLIKKISSE